VDFEVKESADMAPGDEGAENWYLYMYGMAAWYWARRANMRAVGPEGR